jgi:hypothetical protein
VRNYFFIFLFAFLALSCSTQKEIHKPILDISVEQIRQLQIERTKRFNELVGGGVIEFRWTDGDGTHKEQGDLDFWKQGNAISLRVSKLGELLLWFGGNEKEYWLFDMLGDETKLSVDGEGAMFSDIKVALVLLGLSELPDGEMKIVDGVLNINDNTGKIWTMAFEPTSYRPLSVSVIDNSYEAKASHRSEISVELENTHELQWPKTGGLIDVVDTRGGTEIKISFSSLSTLVSEERFDRVMNREFLQKALKPDFIQYGNEND